MLCSNDFMGWRADQRLRVLLEFNPQQLRGGAQPPVMRSATAVLASGREPLTEEGKLDVDEEQVTRSRENTTKLCPSAAWSPENCILE